MIGRWVRVFAFCVLAASSAPSVGSPCAGFTDVADSSSFCAGVTWLKNRGITQGCGAGLYCPADAVTRLHMSAFLSRLQPLLPATLVDQAGTFVGALITADVAGTWKSFVALARNGTAYHARVLPGLAPGAVAAYSLQDLELFYADPTCSGQPYLLVRNVDYALSARFAALVSPSPGSLRLYGASRQVAGIQLQRLRDPANGVCTSIPANPFPDAIYEALDLGPFAFALPLVVQ